MKDLTVIYLTANMVPESFTKYQRKVLLEAIGDLPLISVSRKPIDFGENIIDDGVKSTDNIYRQMLRAAKLAKTEYVAVAEDDVLYPKEHFTFYRPEKDAFAYNQNRFALFNWGTPTYSWRNRKSNCTLIAPRELLIEALEERFAKYPVAIPEEKVGELGRGRIEKNLGVKLRKSVEVFSETSVIQINHRDGSETSQKRRSKNKGPIKAFDIPFWGKAADLIKHYA